MISKIRSSLFSLFLFLFTIIALAGCGPKTTVVLLPEVDGSVGRIAVTSDAGEVEISRPGEATIVRSGAAPSEPEVYSTETIEKTFGASLKALPDPPVHFILYFLSGSTQLTRESLAQLAEIQKSIDARNSQDIAVIGHTDTTGDRKYNMILSRKRAQAVRKILQQNGVPPLNMIVTSHGEENPLIRTPDNVPEPRNRRVEVVVR